MTGSEEIAMMASEKFTNSDRFFTVFVAGEAFHVPRSLLSHFSSLPWCRSTDDWFHLDVVDPKTFRWLLCYYRSDSLPHALQEDPAEMEALHSLAVLLGLTEMATKLAQGKKKRPLTVVDSAKKRARTTRDKLYKKASSWSSTSSKTPCHELVMGSSPSVL